MADNGPEQSRLEPVIEAFLATDPDQEKNIFCQGLCHLPKLSHRLTSSDIDTLGAHTLLEVLASFPGMFVGKDRFGWPSLGMDGALGQQRLGIFIDGVLQNEPFTAQGFLSFPAHLIDHIDVHYGPAGTWFGEGSLMGVIEVATKQWQKILYHGFMATDQGLGGGLSFTHKNDRYKAGINASFSALHQTQTYEQEPRFSLRSSVNSFSLKDVYVSGFLDLKLSQAAQTYVVLRSSLMHEVFDPQIGLTDASKAFGQSRMAFINDIHVVKKRAQKNALDIFCTAGYFRGHHHLSGPGGANLNDRFAAMRLEGGAKFHLKPWAAHDLFLGVGGVIKGITTAEHEVSNNHGNIKNSFKFSSPSMLFGHTIDSFRSAQGHIYGFIQDEWHIRTPIMLALGTRAILPIESKKFSGELMPNLGLVLTPMSRLQFKISYQTSLRSPSFYELSDRTFDAMADDLTRPSDPAVLGFERSRSLESSLWYLTLFDATTIKNGLSIHIAKIDDFIAPDKGVLTNNHELYILGTRSMNEVSFAGGHRFSLGLFYAIAHRKDFDERGYPTCKTSFFNIVTGQDGCDIEKSMPRFILRTSIHLDLLSFGSVSFGNSFLGMTTISDVIKDPYSLLEATYQSKPLWRYLVWFLTIKGGLGGKVYRADQVQSIAPRSFFFERLMAIVGLTISL